VRKHQKDERLWQAWNELDWKEEAELMASHQQYEELKATLQRKKSGTDTGVPQSPSSRGEDRPAHETSQVPAAVEATVPASSIATTADSAAAQPASAAAQSTAAVSAAASSAVSSAAAGASSSTSPSGKTYLIRTKSAPRKASEGLAPIAVPRVVAAKPVVDDDGLALSDPIQLDFVTAMMDHFKANKMLELPTVVELLRRVKGVLKAQPNVVHLRVATRLTIVGDLHGQLDDLFAIFKLNGLPSPRNAYLFNGDFVDRGQYSCECVLTLLAFKLLYPKSVHLNRGNHEARDINSRDGFEKEVCMKYNPAVFDLFSDCFTCLPLAAVINDQIFVVHGGLASTDFTIQQLQEVDRFVEIPPSNSLLEDVLWSDPENKPGRHPSPRGAGIVFGQEVTHAWLHANKMRLIVRSHECQQRGFAMHHGDTMITVFSASNYCGTVNNEGAFILLERDLVPRIVPFYAKPKERLSRYRMRHALLENDIISKLLQRIADNRLALTNYYSKACTTTPSGVRTVSRAVWAEGLRVVLQLNIPFLEFQDYLGLPKLGVDGKKKGDIDFGAFLLRFRPVNVMMQPLTPAQSPHAGSGNGADTPSGRTANQSVECILEMLAKHKYELESLFRHFDLNGDEEISISEFKEGVTSLQSLLGFAFADADLDNLIRHIDTNRDNHISFGEFFNGFRLADPDLSDVQRKAAEMAAQRNKTGSGRPPSTTPSPVITPRTLQEQKQWTEE